MKTKIYKSLFVLLMVSMGIGTANASNDWHQNQMFITHGSGDYTADVINAEMRCEDEYTLIWKTRPRLIEENVWNQIYDDGYKTGRSYASNYYNLLFSTNRDYYLTQLEADYDHMWWTLTQYYYRSNFNPDPVKGSDEDWWEYNEAKHWRYKQGCEDGAQTYVPDNMWKYEGYPLLYLGKIGTNLLANDILTWSCIYFAGLPCNYILKSYSPLTEDHRKDVLFKYGSINDIYTIK